VWREREMYEMNKFEEGTVTHYVRNAPESVPVRL